MISLVNLKILTPLQKLSKNVKDLGNLIVAKGFEKLPKSNESPYLFTLNVTNFFSSTNERMSSFLLVDVFLNGSSMEESLSLNNYQCRIATLSTLQ